MSTPVRIEGLRKRFGKVVALDGVDWQAPAGTAIGLVGDNGSGKSTLLATVAGLLVPTAGTCTTLGRRSDELTADELARIGYVDQDNDLLDWFRVGDHVRYVAAMQPRWDVALERRISDALELDPARRVGDLSKGMRQRLAVLLALAHRPMLLLLDEPVSALDPDARRTVLDLIVERVIEDGATALVSSHVLHDVERVVDHLVVLSRGRVVADASLDDLKESYAEWIVTSSGPDLPARFDEPFVLRREGEGRHARLFVRAGNDDLRRFRARHGANVERRSLDLERLYPLLALKEES